MCPYFLQFRKVFKYLICYGIYELFDVYLLADSLYQPNYYI